jgi:hypothetical protein
MIVERIGNRLYVESKVPCSPAINNWLWLYGVSLESFVKRSRQFERAYLAWETVRNIRNPFFDGGTGFEGYFIGFCTSPEQMLDKLLEIGRDLLERNERLYRHNYAFRSKLLKTLVGECNDPQAIDTWSTLFGATLGKLRCNLALHPEANRFQMETYQSILRLPLMRYQRLDHRIEQKYVVAVSGPEHSSKPIINLHALNPSDYDAGLVVTLIGRFGHPLIRQYLHEKDGKPRED